MNRDTSNRLKELKKELSTLRFESIKDLETHIELLSVAALEIANEPVVYGSAFSEEARQLAAFLEGSVMRFEKLRGNNTDVLA